MNTLINRRRLLLGASALATSPMWLPSLAAAEDQQTLRIRLMEEASIFDPAMFKSTSERWIISSVLPKLITFKAGDSWEWELDAAESIEQVDGKTVNFVLRPGIQWTDGYGELTAEDVKYSFERFLDAELNSPSAPNWGPLDHVEVTGKYSGTIHLKQPYGGLFGYVLPHDCAQIVCKKAVEEVGGKFGSSVPASAGPYKFVEYVSGQRVVVERNDSWYGEKPAFARIEFVPINDTKAAENAVLSGDIDWAVIGISSVPALQAALPENLALDVMPTPNLIFLGANMTNPVLQNADLRKALQLAIDQEAILEGAFYGVAKRAHGLAVAGMPGYLEEPLIQRDVEAARALVEQAGASGLTLNLDVQAETDKITAAQIIQANLAEIGINLEISQHEAGAFWSLAEEKKEDLQLFISAFVGVPPDLNWMTQWLLPEQAGIWNWQHFISEEFRELHLASSAASSVAEKDELLKRMQVILDESYSTLILTHPPRPVLYNSAKLKPAMLPDGTLVLPQSKSV